MRFQDEIRELVKQNDGKEPQWAERAQRLAGSTLYQIKKYLLSSARLGEYHSVNGKRIIRWRELLPKELWEAKEQETLPTFSTTWYGKRVMTRGYSISCDFRVAPGQEQLYNAYLSRLKELAEQDGIRIGDVIVIRLITKQEYPFPGNVPGGRADENLCSVYIDCTMEV